MTDTGQVPGEGLPENAGMVEQPGVPAHGAYTYLSETTAEDAIGIDAAADKPVRAGWAEAAQDIAAAGDDALVWGEFGNAEDAEFEW